MITAKEAREKITNINTEATKFAKNFIANEEPFLNEATLEAIQDSKYETSYWWSSSFFPNASYRNAVGIALEHWFHDHGYYCCVVKNDMGVNASWALKVIWNWEMSDHE